MSRNILITGARAPVAVDLGRSFTAAGYAVHFADSVPCAAASMSRGATVHRLPAPARQFRAFADALAELVARIDPVAVVPTCEEIFYVAAAGCDRTLAPPLPVLRKLHSKIEFAAYARSLGIVAPDTWRVGDVLPLPSEELVFKPEFSRFATHTLIQPDARRLARVAPDRGWAAQRFVAGEEFCLWSFAREGRIVAAAAYRPVWRHGHAAAYAFETFDCPEAVAIAQTVAAADAITGHLSFDLIRTADGSVMPIECNPRAVSGLHLFDAHADLARAMLGEIEVATPVAGVRYLGPAMLLLGTASGQWRRLARDWRRGRDATGRPGDRMPALGTLIDAARFAAQGLVVRRSASAATTSDIEWNGEPIG